MEHTIDQLDFWSSFSSDDAGFDNPFDLPFRTAEDRRQQRAIEDFLDSDNNSLLFGSLPLEPLQLEIHIPFDDTREQPRIPCETPLQMERVPGVIKQFEPSNDDESADESTDEREYEPKPSPATIAAIIAASRKSMSMDISPFCRYPMREAAKMIKIPCSTLGKRWKSATKGRQWPYRRLKKLEEEIHKLWVGISTHPTAEEELRLEDLVKERKFYTAPIYIKTNKGKFGK
eukprot:TRINITY_DN1540_c0_g1_i1.p1 TRINITY_DN1540_c0_g1~~TRINITY_DN1540_c0_g1_i1.p1  ORF type:complete len:252 (+),score=62.21 TRINITY_DN1540_c0_g1_i1:66-758(+)